MKKFFLISAFSSALIFLSCSGHEEYNPIKEESTESANDSIQVHGPCYSSEPSIFEKYDSVRLDAALFQIEQSLKVQELFNLIELDSTRRTFILISDENDQDEIIAKIQEDNGTNCITHFTFIILPRDNYKTSYYNPFEDSRIDLAEWNQK